MGVKDLVLNKNVTLVDHFVSTNYAEAFRSDSGNSKFIKLFDLDILSISIFFDIFKVLFIQETWNILNGI